MMTIDRRRFGGKRKAKDEMGGDKVSSSQCKFDNKGVVVDDNKAASDQIWTRLRKGLER